MTEIYLYKVFYRIAKGWPPTYLSDGTELVYKRINTFATVDSEPEILGEQLAKDERWKDKELFFSRPWEIGRAHV